MKCEHCHADISETALFCDKCGALQHHSEEFINTPENLDPLAVLDKRMKDLHTRPFHRHAEPKEKKSVPSKSSIKATILARDQKLDDLTQRDSASTAPNTGKDRVVQKEKMDTQMVTPNRSERFTVRENGAGESQLADRADASPQSPANGLLDNVIRKKMRGGLSQKLSSHKSISVEQTEGWNMLIIAVYLLGIVVFFVPWVKMNFFGRMNLLQLSGAFAEILNDAAIYGLTSTGLLSFARFWLMGGVVIPVAYAIGAFLVFIKRADRIVKYTTGGIAFFYTVATLILLNFAIFKQLGADGTIFYFGLWLTLALSVVICFLPFRKQKAAERVSYPFRNMQF